MIVANHCTILQRFQMGVGETDREFSMDAINQRHTKHEAQRMQASREELVERIAHAVREDGHTEPLQGLYLYRRSVPLEPGHSVTKPSLCVIARGVKKFFWAIPTTGMILTLSSHHYRVA